MKMGQEGAMNVRKFGLLFLLAILLAACNSEASPPQETAVQQPAAPQATATAPQNPPPSGVGQTYFVDGNGSDGSDGSAGTPWQTLQFAANQVAPGDTILVQSGTYAGLRIERSGTAEAWITLKAAPGASVLIDRPGADNRHESNIELETWEGDGTIAYWVIEGLEVADAPGWGIDTRGSETTHSHHIVIQSNTVHDNGLGSEKTGIFFAFVDDVVVTGNESYANGEHGIYLSNSGDRFLVQGNKLHHNNNCGLHMNGDESEGGDGIISEGVVEANIIYENGEGGCSAINMDGVTDTIVRNNLLYQNHAGGISIFQENGALCSQRNRILNNTILMAEDGRWAINVSDSSCVNNQLFNNVILTSHDWRGSILIPEPGIDGFESDYNVLMDRFSADDDNSVIDLAAWQALGYDANSFVAAPEALFVAANEGDFRPSNGSLLLDAGIELPDVSEDLLGAPRPAGGGHDSGAYESGEVSQAPAAEDSPASSAAAGEGLITYTLDGRVYRLAAQEGAAPEDISLALDELAAGSNDRGLNVSPDGAWMVLESERFDAECVDWSCLILLTADLSSGEAVRAAGEIVHPQGFSAVASGGSMLIYPAGDGPHELDLWAVTRDGSTWSTPQLLTAGSPYTYNDVPAISADGAHVVFDCGDEPYGAAGTAICEVGSDGSGLRVLLTPANGPAGFPNTGALHSPDYAPDGSILFEADWDGERLWRLPAGGTEPLPITAEFGNDNSPCVLPDGRIVSLWLNRPGGQGLHELKIMTAGGDSFYMALEGVDVIDSGLGCGG